MSSVTHVPINRLPQITCDKTVPYRSLMCRALPCCWPPPRPPALSLTAPHGPARIPSGPARYRAVPHGTERSRTCPARSRTCPARSRTCHARHRTVARRRRRCAAYAASWISAGTAAPTWPLAGTTAPWRRASASILCRFCVGRQARDCVLGARCARAVVWCRVLRPHERPCGGHVKAMRREHVG